jgi:putative N6-adenine-specific DNA methylase
MPRPPAEALDLFVACLPGLEPFVAEECAELGVTAAQPIRVGSGGVECRGDLATLARLNLRLGCASHVLVRIARFHARHFAELHKRATQLPWSDWLRPGARVLIKAHSQKSKLYHTGGIAERIAAAIVEVLGAEVLPPGAEDAGAVPLQARLFDDVCTLSLDSSGQALHACGWRLETAKAPLREDLAHALLRASGWDPTTPLCDPFCGSGTIPIAAARRARGLPPRLGRRFAFEQFAGADPRLLAAAAAEVEPAPADRAPARIVGCDRDAGAVAIAVRNAERAGVGAEVEFVAAALSACPGFEIGGDAGAVVTNPPFGHRVGGPGRSGAGPDLLPLYQALGARLAALGPGWRRAILCADRRLALRTGLPLRSAFLSSHGGLKVWAMVG